jgi:hypothetical protein
MNNFTFAHALDSGSMATFITIKRESFSLFRDLTWIN